MNKKITSTALAALMIAGSTSFSAFAAMDIGTVVIGTKAFDLAYANDPANATEISAAITANSTVFVKNYDGNWIDNISGSIVNASVIPAVTYTNSKGTSNYAAGDKDASTVATSVAVTNNSVKSFKATFNGIVADTSKVVFTVSQGTTVVKTISAAWNTGKTEAILTNSENLPQGEYTVNVKNDTTDLGTTKLTVDQQKVAKIDITSSKLGLSNKKLTDSKEFQKGYATYKVLDQYGNDITDSSLANSITFQTGAGTIEGKNGTITITPTMNLLQFATVSVTAYDTTSGSHADKVLDVNKQPGTLNSIKLSALTNKDNKVLTAEDTSSLFYITYEATDNSGNPTTDYDLVKNGLILNEQDELTSGGAYVTTKVVHDPSDSKKAAIQVQVKSATDSISMDMPLSITAMTYASSSSTLNVTLKRAAKVSSIQLQVPSYNIAIGEDKEIPFVAQDQNGKVLTKYSDVVTGDVTVNGAFFSKDGSGNAVLRIGAEDVKGSGRGNGVSTDGQRNITATVSSGTGKFSSITINVQKKVMADTLSLDTAQYKTIFQKGATQKIDFGYDKGGLIVKDQYDRNIDMTTGKMYGNTDNSKYYVTAESNAPGIVDVTTNTSDGRISTGEKQITLKAGVAGTATITFRLYNKDTTKSDGSTSRDPSVAVDTQTQTLTVLENKDIKDYTMDEVKDPIYTDVEIGGNVTNDRAIDYKANPEVFGKTSSGAKVKLAGTPITGATVSNDTDFTIFHETGDTNVSDSVKVAARKLVDPAKTGATTTLTINVKGVDGDTYPVTTTITSSTVKPEAKSLAIVASTEKDGVDITNDTVTLTGSANNSYNQILGMDKTQKSTYGSLAAYDKDGMQKGSKNVYIGATDQYGQDSMALSQFRVINDGTDSNGNPVVRTKLSVGAEFIIDNDGTIIKNTAKSGDFVTVTGTTSNGLMKTVKIVFAGSDTNIAVPVGPVVPVGVITAVNNATSASAMRSALENTNLGLNLTVYNQLNNSNKDSVSKTLYNNSVGAYTVASLQSALNATDEIKAQVSLNTSADGMKITAAKAAVSAYEGAPITTFAQVKAAQGLKAAADTAVAAVSDATQKSALELRVTTQATAVAAAKVTTDAYALTPEAKAAAAAEFDTKLATADNAILGGTVDNTKKEITIVDATKTTDTGVFAQLDALNVTSVKLGTTTIDLSDKVAAKAAVTNYFMKNGLNANTAVVITVTGTNGAVSPLNYTLLAIK
ncbi:cell wall-binding repeat-containing protein [Clostridium estertheticum]|uniref:cell wall-binding repeat-containing protein n=1 Tax=Clostridium estertheticum TaxID=238834 RepID=UPI001C0E184C|nr:cell wall-binding repeat-containing protein [Clostridium estertheticum]MBU3183965.1 cell wall-binding repeat-containing protein [Clostridium estertheticum]